MNQTRPTGRPSKAVDALLLLGMAAGAQETNYAKRDFVPGDEIIFDDPVEKEKKMDVFLFVQFRRSRAWNLLLSFVCSRKAVQTRSLNMLAFHGPSAYYMCCTTEN